jgi:hypothetical protein
MPRRSVRSFKDPLRRSVSDLLERANRRVVTGRTVAVFEYPFTPSARWGWDKPPHPELTAVLAKGDRHYADIIASLREHLDDYRHIPRHAAAGQLAWANNYWGGVDAVMQYTALCTRRPAQYIEVGSGYSTLFARDAITRHGLTTRITSIDPSPRADVDAACDHLWRGTLEDAPSSLFDGVVAGDVIVIDGSHLAFMGSDAVVALLELLPRFPPGVLVGIDDIFLPWDYHPTWNRRWYGEQYVLAGMLLGGLTGWRIEFPGWYLAQHKDFTGSLAPIWEIVEPEAGRLATSFWMERTAD